jgi:hypothetical protein
VPEKHGNRHDKSQSPFDSCMASLLAKPGAAHPELPR